MISGLWRRLGAHVLLPRNGARHALAFVLTAYLVCALAPLVGLARVRLQHVGEALMLAFQLATLGYVLARARHLEERRFWRCLGAGLACWLASQALLAWQPAASRGLSLLTDGLYLLQYLCLLLAADQQPHLADGWSRGDKPYRLSVLGTLACGAAFLAYFVLIPELVSQAAPRAQLSSYALLVSLDAVVAWRFLQLRRRASDSPWHATYGLIALTYAAWMPLDLLEGAAERGILTMPAVAGALWVLPHLAFLAALFARRVALSAGPAPEPVGPARREPTSLLAAALSLPLLHLLLDAGGLAAPGSRPALALTALASAVVVGGLALALQVLLERSNARLRTELSVQASQALLSESQRLQAIGRLGRGAAQAFERLLTLVLGHADLIDAGLAPLDRLRRHSSELQRATQRAAAIARLLQDPGPQAAHERRPVALGAVIEELSPALGVLLGERVRLRTVVEADAGLLLAERTQLEQLIASLALATVEAQGGAGELTLEVGRRATGSARSLPRASLKPSESLVTLVARLEQGPSSARASAASHADAGGRVGLLGVGEQTRLTQLAAELGGRLSKRLGRGSLPIGHHGPRAGCSWRHCASWATPGKTTTGSRPSRRRCSWGACGRPAASRFTRCWCWRTSGCRPTVACQRWACAPA